MFESSRYCGIYAIVNNVTGRIYLGHASTTFAKRWREHRRLLGHGEHHNQELQHDWIELGSGAFDFVIVELFPKNTAYLHSLRALERRYIVTSECWLYNATKDAYRRTDEFLIEQLY